MTLRTLLVVLLISAVVLAIASLFVGGLSILLFGLGDLTAASVTKWIAVSLGISWIIALILLILFMAARAVSTWSHIDQETSFQESPNDEDSFFDKRMTS